LPEIVAFLRSGDLSRAIDQSSKRATSVMIDA
jgi:hypothetical protein